MKSEINMLRQKAITSITYKIGLERDNKNEN